MSLHEYENMMIYTREYATFAEIQAAAEVLDISIRVFVKDTRNNISVSSFSSTSAGRDTVYVLLHAQHYILLQKLRNITDSSVSVEDREPTHAINTLFEPNNNPNRFCADSVSVSY